MKNILVIKIGSSILLTERQKLDEYRIAQIADQIIHLRAKGVRVILVVSGAVALGSKFISITDNISRQSAAGIGQVLLTSVFNSIFSQKELQIGQILLTKHELIKNKEKLSSAISLYLDLGFIPFINENDIVNLNGFSGNDFLSGEIVKLVSAKKLIIMSTMKGSIYGVGKGEAKMTVLSELKKYQIEGVIVDGKIKNILLNQ